MNYFHMTVLFNYNCCHTRWKTHYAGLHSEFFIMYSSNCKHSQQERKNTLLLLTKAERVRKTIVAQNISDNVDAYELAFFAQYSYM